MRRLFFFLFDEQPQAAFPGFAKGGMTGLPRFVSATTIIGSSTTAAAAPGGIKPGMFMLALGSWRGSSWVLPKGWQDVGHRVAAADDTAGKFLAYRFTDETDTSTSTYTFGGVSNNFALCIALFEGVDPYNPFLTNVTDYNTSGITTIPATSIPANGLGVVCAAVNSGNNGQSSIFTYGSSWIKMVYEITGNRNTVGMAMYSDSNPVIIPETTIAGSLGNPEHRVVLVLSGSTGVDF